MAVIFFLNYTTNKAKCQQNKFQFVGENKYLEGWRKTIASPQNLHRRKQRKGFENCFSKPILVGVAGFEPTASKSQTSRATSCATPRSVKILDFSVEFCKWSNLWSSLYLKNNFSSANMLKTQHLQGFSAIWCLVEQGGGNLLPKHARYQLRHTPMDGFYYNKESAGCQGEFWRSGAFKF